MEFDAAVTQLEALVETLEREGDERALLLLALIDAVHRPALELIARGEFEHPLAQALLAMYDLAPPDERTLVEEALDEVRPYIHSHGGELDLLDVSAGVVHVRMSGSCDGCAASAMTLRRGIENVLRERYPAFKKVIADEAGLPITAIPLPIVQVRRPVFAPAGTVDELPPGKLGRADVEGTPLLLVNVDGDIYAFRDGCPADGMSLQGGRIAGSVIVCPWHNCGYDARSGKRVDEPGQPGLTAVPVAVRDGIVQAAVNVA